MTSEIGRGAGARQEGSVTKGLFARSKGGKKVCGIRDMLPQINMEAYITTERERLAVFRYA